MPAKGLLEASWNTLGGLSDPSKVLLKFLRTLLEASWDAIATLWIQGILGPGGEEPGGGEQANRLGSLGYRTAGRDPAAPGLAGTADTIAPGLMDRGKDYASQPWCPWQWISLPSELKFIIILFYGAQFLFYRA